MITNRAAIGIRMPVLQKKAGRKKPKNNFEYFDYKELSRRSD